MFQDSYRHEVIEILKKGDRRAQIDILVFIPRASQNKYHASSQFVSTMSVYKTLRQF